MNRNRNMFAHAKRVGGSTTNFSLPTGSPVVERLHLVPTYVRPIQLHPLPRLRQDQIEYIREAYASMARYGVMFKDDIEASIEEALESHS